PGSQAHALHARDRPLSGGAACRRDRGARAHAHAVRPARGGGESHQPARGRAPGMNADFYKILGVAMDATADDVKRAYRKLAMEHHPDRNNGDKKAEEKFKEITEAYEVLRHPDLRANYDRYGEAGVKGAGGGRGAGGFGAQHVDLSEALNIFMRDFG